MSFAREVREPAFAARDVPGDKSARTLAKDILAINDEQYRAAFNGSAMKRATIAGLQRTACVVLANADAGNAERYWCQPIDERLNEIALVPSFHSQHKQFN